uniref:Leucine-rich repeat-containing N-terminal plant-type domain-containing protein n=1 Tax=Tetradesmus obliquus TaxID=3088 RepID=A0A383WFC7_TETOB|eukprot:jgi/Sobl393_1/1101/SZX72055.1
MQLTGTLTASLATYYNLQHLDLSGNSRLTGSLPSLWSALTALQTLDVSNTGISGSLPPSWASLQKLRAFRAADCSGLSGQLPLEWGILRSLEELVVTNSNLSGALPAWTDAGAVRAAADAALAAAQQAPSVQVNQAAAADVSPATVQRRKTPTARDRGGYVGPRATTAARSRAVSALSAAIAAAPAGTRFMPLRVINLSGNKLSGQLVPGWSLFEQLQVLVLANNSLTGSLPESSARLTTLALSSTLPASWVSLRKLQQLDLSNNALVSPIPEAWSYLYVGSGSLLRCLALFGNAGLSTAELAALKGALEQRATGKLTVVVSGGGPKCASLQQP